MSAEKKENIWLNLGFNIVAPSLLLIKGRDIYVRFFEAFDGLDAAIFVLALAFPLLYGVYDLVDRRKWNIFSIIGLASVVLTGGIGLLRLSREYMVLKETAVPLVLGIAVLATAFTKRPLAKMIMLNDSVVDVEKIDAALESSGTRGDYDASLRSATYWIAASFLMSAALNFILASMIFKSEPGTDAFNAEVGEMTALSFPVIVLPTMVVFIVAMYRFFTAITKCTGLKIEDIVSSKK